MNTMAEPFRHNDKLPLIFRQLPKSRSLHGAVPQEPRGERMQRWQHRLERLFARQVY